MGIRHRLTDSERDDLTKDVDDLDAVYMEKLRKDGISEDLLAQFRDLTLELEKDKDKDFYLCANHYEESGMEKIIISIG